MLHVCECTCARLSLSHTLSPLPFPSFLPSCLSVPLALFFLHMLISHLLFVLSGAPDPPSPQYQMSTQTKREEVPATRYVKMKAKRVFDSLSCCAAEQPINNRTGEPRCEKRVCLFLSFFFFFLRGFSHKANNFTRDCSIYGYIRCRRDPRVLATRHHTDCNNAKLFAITSGEKSAHRTV